MARRVLLWSLTIVLFTVIILCLPDVYLLPQQQDLFSEPLKLGYGHLSKHPDSMLLFISDRVSLWGGGGGGPLGFGLFLPSHLGDGILLSII